MKCGGVVLAGGRSSRMGRPKALLPFGPEVMLQRVVRLLHEVVEPIVVVAAPGQTLPALPKTVRVVQDEQPGRGPLEGLRVGLSALEGTADAAYATSCDVPLLVPDFVRRLISLLEEGGQKIVVPEAEGYRHPLAAVYCVEVVPAIERLLADDRRRPAYLFDEVPTRVVPAESLRAVDPQLQTLRNLNRPEDYFAALAEAGLGGGGLADGEW